MAVTLKPLYPTIREAKERRTELLRYLRLDGGRRLIAAALLLALMSGLNLAQTGRLATQGHAVAQLQRQQTELLRERSNLQLRLARAQSLTDIERRAARLNLRPMKPEQARYITIGALDDREPSEHDHPVLNP
jgi:type VI protein secretion system component VasF